MDALPIPAGIITAQVDVTCRTLAEYVCGISVSPTHMLGRRAHLRACLRACLVSCVLNGNEHVSLLCLL